MVSWYPEDGEALNGFKQAEKQKCQWKEISSVGLNQPQRASWREALQEASFKLSFHLSFGLLNSENLRKVSAF